MKKKKKEKTFCIFRNNLLHGFKLFETNAANEDEVYKIDSSILSLIKSDASEVVIDVVVFFFSSFVCFFFITRNLHRMINDYIWVLLDRMIDSIRFWDLKEMVYLLTVGSCRHILPECSGFCHTPKMWYKPGPELCRATNFTVFEIEIGQATLSHLTHRSVLPLSSTSCCLK